MNFSELRERIEDNTVKSERAKGALQRVKDELKNEFGFKTTKEAEEYLTDLDEEIDELKEEVTKLEEEIQEELEEIDGSE